MWIKDYLKSVMVNKITLAGYASIGLSLGMVGTGFVLQSMGMDEGANAMFPSFIYPLLPGSFLLGLSAFGIGTRDSYKRARKHIQENETIKENLVGAYNKGDYCNKVGIRLAAKESDLEHLLE